MRAFDVRLAMRSAAALYAVGAALLAFAGGVDDRHRAPIIGLTALAIAVGFLLLIIDRAGRGSLLVVFVADVLAAAIIATLVGLSDGAHSPYSPYFMLVALHAAVFQPRARVVAVMAITTAAFLAPLVYDPDAAGWFAKVAIAGVIPALVLVWVIHLVVLNLRRERRALAAREAGALRLAESDGLTGLGNYRRFWRALQSEVARSRRHSQPFSVIVLDLDGFKAINDELGHQTGDEALRRVARALEREVRAEDVLCRQGGDEFGVIAVAAPASEAGELARRLVDAVADAGRGLARPLSASAGWATFGDPERTAEGLLGRADQALRSAKPGLREPGVPALLPSRPGHGSPDRAGADRRPGAGRRPPRASG